MSLNADRINYLETLWFFVRISANSKMKVSSIVFVSNEPDAK